MRTSAILDVYFLSGNILQAFKQAGRDPHAQEGALVAAVACMAGSDTHFYKNLGISMVGLPGGMPVSASGSRYFNQLAHSEIVYDFANRSPAILPVGNPATNRSLNGHGPHLIHFMLNDQFRRDVDAVVQCLPPMETEPLDILRNLRLKRPPQYIKSPTKSTAKA